MGRDRKYLVPRVLHGTGFVHADVAGLGRDHPLIIPQHGRDDRGIGLRTAHKEKDLSVGRAADGPDPGPGAFAVRVHPVAGKLFKIRDGEALQDLRMRSFRIVAGKGYHRTNLHIYSDSATNCTQNVALFIYLYSPNEKT